MTERPRRRRRAVGPAGARPVEEPALDLEPEREPPADPERYRREQPPHHDRGV